MKIDHIGYAVKKLDKSIAIFEKMGFKKGGAVDDFNRNVRICFMEMNHYKIELVSYLDKKKYSPIDDVLLKNGPIPYHICYMSDDLEKDIAELEKDGFKVIIQPCQALALNNRRVVFMMNLAIGLIEIAESSVVL